MNYFGCNPSKSKSKVEVMFGKPVTVQYRNMQVVKNTMLIAELCTVFVLLLWLFVDLFTSNWLVQP